MHFSFDMIVRGHHAYPSMWEAAVGEELACQRERANPKHPFVVAVMKGERIVGHVPRRISSVCAMLIRRGGSIIH